MINRKVVDEITSDRQRERESNRVIGRVLGLMTFMGLWMLSFSTIVGIWIKLFWIGWVFAP